MSVIKKVLVIGASGFVGKAVAKALLAGGYTVRCLARNPARVADLAAAGCQTVVGDVANYRSIEDALCSMDAVYVSIHTLSPQPSAAGQGFMQVEINGLRNIVAACEKTGTSRLIYLTFLGITPDAPSAWARERWKAEQLLLQSGLAVTVLRPAQIVGRGGWGFERMLSQAGKPLAIDLFGNGGQRMRNIALDDLIYYLVGVLEDSRAYGRIFDVGCDDVLTNNQMLDAAAEVLGRPHPRKIHLPLSLMAAIAPLLERVAKLPPGAFRGILDGRNVDAIGDPAPIRSLLPRPPLTYRQAIQRALV